MRLLVTTIVAESSGVARSIVAGQLMKLAALFLIPSFVIRMFQPKLY